LPSRDGKGSRAALEGAAREHRRAKGEKVAEGEHERAVREHGGAGGEHERARREQGGAQREHMAEMGLSAGAIQLYRILETRGYYIYIYHAQRPAAQQNRQAPSPQSVLAPSLPHASPQKNPP